MSLIVGVRFADLGKLYYYDPGPLELETGDCVLVETARGLEFGEIVLGPREVEDTELTNSLKKVAKRADDRDFRKLEQNVKREEEAFHICEDRIEKRELEMKLIDVEYTFDGSKLIFYFTAEGRVDFRELVKDLAAVFRTRIEMRQIGVRDAAKKIGGLGPCGRAVCCNAFLNDFAPVSIRTAKEQNLSLSPTKISGLCGRLMCCIHYEHEHYKEMNRRLPRVGSIVETADGPAEVVETDPLCERIKGRITLSDGSADVRRYTLEDLQEASKRSPQREREQEKEKGRAERGERHAEKTRPHADREDHDGTEESAQARKHASERPKKRRPHIPKQQHAEHAHKPQEKDQKRDGHAAQSSNRRRSDKKRASKRPKEAKNETHAGQV